MNTGALARIMRAVLTGDRQAFKVTPGKEDIKAAQILKQLTAMEAAIAVTTRRASAKGRLKKQSQKMRKRAEAEWKGHNQSRCK